MKHAATWTARPAVPAPVKTRSLRNGLLWTFGILQALWAALYLYVDLSANSEMTGELFHDFGVAVATQVMLDEIVNYWITSSIGAAVVLGLIYIGFKVNWEKKS